MPRIAPSCRIPPKQLTLLEQRMQTYYGEVRDYPAFQTSSQHDLERRHVLAEVKRQVLGVQGTVTILEFGSGRSGFPSWLRNQLASAGVTTSVTITCQDVTETNRTYLQQVADDVLISSLQEGVFSLSSFDIIFSTHCFEHVARPEQILHMLTSVLRPGGALLLFAPRYDLPFYLSPSSGDLSNCSQLLLSLRLLLIRLKSRLRGRPAFVIDTQPACLDRPFWRDADAIHWVSLHDFHLFARCAGLAITELDISLHAPLLSKQWLIDRYGKLAIKLQKPISNP